MMDIAVTDVKFIWSDRRQTISWTNVFPDHCYLMVSQGHYKLKRSLLQLYTMLQAVNRRCKIHLHNNAYSSRLFAFCCGLVSSKLQTNSSRLFRCLLINPLHDFWRSTQWFLGSLFPVRWYSDRSHGIFIIWIASLSLSINYIWQWF